MQDILVCFGTRPEAIKIAPVIHELINQNISFQVCVTAQHREMLDQVLDFFEIVPDFDLDLMQPNQSLNQISAGILQKMDEILEQVSPSIVLVQGDTTTAAIVSLAAFHRGIKVGHIEAGLRTYNKNAPYPEEVNRQIISRIADFHFAPTFLSQKNLINEQIPEAGILVTGNTVVDALQWAFKKLNSEDNNKEINVIRSILDPQKKLILVTGHRRENFGEGLKNICEALDELAERHEVEIIYPVHLNPNVQGPVKELLANRKNIHLIEPVSYPVMLWLIQLSYFIISDSGGIQEEAPACKKMVLVTREVSERMEGVVAGYSILVGTDKKRILEEAKSLLIKLPDLSEKENPYGDGTAAKQVVSFLKNL